MNQQPPRDQGISRRNLVAASGAAAAGLLLLNEVVGADNPAANVDDRASSIRITGFKTYPAGSKTFLKIETNQQVFGWGEISQLPPTVAVPLVQSMWELLDGENPTRIEHLWQKVFRAHRDFRGGAFMMHTLAGIDMALWDITGKLHGVPVYRLMGGPTRDKIRVYPTPKAYKVPPGGPRTFSGSPADVEALTNGIKEARERVGKDGTVMFDAHCCLPPPLMIQLANAIEPYDVLWIEEPAVPGNIEVKSIQWLSSLGHQRAAGDRRARPHDLGRYSLLARKGCRHFAARLRARRGADEHEKDRRAGRGVSRADCAALYRVVLGYRRQLPRHRFHPAVPHSRVVRQRHGRRTEAKLGSRPGGLCLAAARSGTRR